MGKLFFVQFLAENTRIVHVIDQSIALCQRDCGSPCFCGVLLWEFRRNGVVCEKMMDFSIDFFSPNYFIPETDERALTDSLTTVCITRQTRAVRTDFHPSTARCSFRVQTKIYWTTTCQFYANTHTRNVMRTRIRK